MKQWYVLVFVMFLYGCTSYEVEIIQPNEMGLNNHFVGKIFEIECKSFLQKGKDNNKNCRKHISIIAHQKGYSYFTVLNSNVSSQNLRINSITNTPLNLYNKETEQTYIPQTNVYGKDSAYLFILIDEKDIKNWKNYYKVSDYYPEKEESKRRERVML